MSQEEEEKKKLPEIKIASQVAIEALEPYVDQVLEAISLASGFEGAKHALVTDESWVSDFYPYPGVPTGKTRPHPFWPDKLIHTYNYDTEENRAYLKKLSELLNLPVDRQTAIYELAIGLRKRDME